MKEVVASLSWRWSALVKMKAFVEWFVSKLPSCAYLVLVSLSRGLHALYPLSHLFEMLVDPVLRHWPRFYWYCSNKYGVWSALPRLLFAMKGLCGSQGLTEIPWCALRMICVEQPNVRCRSESVNCMGTYMTLPQWARLQDIPLWFEVVCFKSNFLDTWLTFNL